MLNTGQADLPFGSIGHSGMEHYRSRGGFETFSKKCLQNMVWISAV
jgi:hypothetical protein